MGTYTLTVTGGNTLSAYYPKDFDRYWTFRTGYELSVRDALKAMAFEGWEEWNKNDYTEYFTLARFRKLETLLNYIVCEPCDCKCPRCQ